MLNKWKSFWELWTEVCINNWQMYCWLAACLLLCFCFRFPVCFISSHVDSFHIHSFSTHFMSGSSPISPFVFYWQLVLLAGWLLAAFAFAFFFLFLSCHLISTSISCHVASGDEMDQYLHQLPNCMNISNISVRAIHAKAAAKINENNQTFPDSPCQIDREHQ